MKNELRVIGAGFGRTGTDSMREAIELLGFGPCHHMRAVIESEVQQKDWINAIRSGELNWEILLGGYNSCVDWPSAYYWPQLIQAYPDAKVLLTWRTAESWWKSFSNTILPSITSNKNQGIESVGTLLTEPFIFQGGPMEKAHCIKIYVENVENVKASVPSDQLLIYNLGDGWESLCNFLGVDVPNVPFPRSNDAGEFHTWGA